MLKDAGLALKRAMLKRIRVKMLKGRGFGGALEAGQRLKMQVIDAQRRGFGRSKRGLLWLAQFASNKRKAMFTQYSMLKRSAGLGSCIKRAMFTTIVDAQR